MTNRASVISALTLIGLLFCLLASPATGYAANLYGHVELVEGKVTIIDSKGQSRVPRVNDTIEEGETIVTGRDGELQARTEDYGYISLRANTKMTVESYRAEGGSEDKSVVSLLVGTFRTVTGWIGKYNPNQHTVRTATATIGIRGTDHEPLFIPPPGPGEKAVGAPGTYDKVNFGSTVIRNQKGEVVVPAGKAGFAPHDAKAAPKALDRVPDFYRPTANEGKIESRKEELTKEVEQKRLEKQKAAAAKAKAETAKEEAKTEKEEAQTPKEEAESAKEEAHKKASKSEKKRRPSTTK
jgi:FecR protein